jgi:signal transduction histidine kinase
LLGNALKYASGDITLRLARRGQFARVEVENGGLEIPASLRRRIFKPYVTGDQRNHGLGLGLYVARAIIHHHGGEMGLRSVPAGGVIFWLTLPLSD